VVRPGDVIREDELSRAIQLAALKLQAAGSGAILVLFDADESCPATLGPALQQVADRVRPDVHTRVVLAKQEFESWLLGGLSTIDAPESISNPKDRLKEHVAGRRYAETVDQARLAAAFDMANARMRCRSFRKLLDEIDALFSRLFA